MSTSKNFINIGRAFLLLCGWRHQLKAICLKQFVSLYSSKASDSEPPVSDLREAVRQRGLPEEAHGHPSGGGGSGLATEDVALLRLSGCLHPRVW